MHGTHKFILREQIIVNAPLERCFLLSTSIKIVERELGMHPVRGKTAGLIGEGETVRWEGWQLGFPNFHESIIERFEPNVFFRDRMINGRFRSFEHDHNFAEETSGSVRMFDELRFSMPLGWPGQVVGRLVLEPHIRKLMRRRFRLLTQIAESDEWREYLKDF